METKALRPKVKEPFELRKPPALVNPDMVKRGVACLNLADFCKNLPGNCKIAYFKNTVKYSCRFDLNQDAPAVGLRGAGIVL